MKIILKNGKNYLLIQACYEKSEVTITPKPQNP